MAKIAFTKLGLTKNQEVRQLTWNEQIIEVKQYLPIQEKMNLLSTVLNNCQDENNFINEAKLQLYFDLEVVFRYTNINFTDKQKEDVAKLFDLINGSGLLNKIDELLPEEVDNLFDWLRMTAHNIYDYRNSIYGILDALNTDYKNLELDAEKLQEKIADPKTLELLKGILTKIG